jgi:hypothetical protein
MEEGARFPGCCHAPTSPHKSILPHAILHFPQLSTIPPFSQGESACFNIAFPGLVRQFIEP